MVVATLCEQEDGQGILARIDIAQGEAAAGTVLIDLAQGEAAADTIVRQTMAAVKALQQEMVRRHGEVVRCAIEIG